MLLELYIRNFLNKFIFGRYFLNYLKFLPSVSPTEPEFKFMIITIRQSIRFRIRPKKISISQFLAKYRNFVLEKYEEIHKTQKIYSNYFIIFEGPNETWAFFQMFL